MKTILITLLVVAGLAGKTNIEEAAIHPASDSSIVLEKNSLFANIPVQVHLIDENGIVASIDTTMDAALEMASTLMMLSAIESAISEYAEFEEVAVANCGCIYVARFGTKVYLDPGGEFPYGTLDKGIFLMLGETGTEFARVATEAGAPDELFRIFYIPREDISYFKEETEYFRVHGSYTVEDMPDCLPTPSTIP